MHTPSLIDAVRSELLLHPEVTESAHRFGGTVFHVGRLELGHLHGETVADLPFPPHIRDELVAAGRVERSEHAGDSRWVSKTVQHAGDVAQVVELFRLSYEYAVTQPQPPEPPPRQPAPAPRRGWRRLLGRG